MTSDFEEGDLLVIDCSVEWTDNKIALCFVDGELIASSTDDAFTQLGGFVTRLPHGIKSWILM